MKEIKVGDSLPSFSLKNQRGEWIDSNDWKDSPVVVYFYPSDFTRVCTAQACFFKDSYQDFKKLNTRVVGISPDSVISHRQFASRYELPFDLLSDNRETVRSLFGVPRGLLGMVSGRVTYVFDAQGKLVFRYQAEIKAKEHVSKALEVLKKRSS
ncbi:MAG: peroxiredoxin [Aureispira sp.]